MSFILPVILSARINQLSPFFKRSEIWLKVSNLHCILTNYQNQIWKCTDEILDLKRKNFLKNFADGKINC